MEEYGEVNSYVCWCTEETLFVYLARCILYHVCLAYLDS
jgi:hypothetical protein